MKNRLVIFFTLTLCLLTGLTGCKKDVDASPESTESTTAAVTVNDNTTIEDGVLFVGIRPGSSPYIDKDEEGRIEGFEIDLANAIGELTLLNVKFIEMDYKDIYAELDVSSFDCIISGAVFSDAVDKVYDFSVPYYSDAEGNDYCMVVKTGNNRLLNVLNQSINILKTDGSLEEMYNRWNTAEPEESTEADSADEEKN